jgi:sulfite exporter TauE/SafE
MTDGILVLCATAASIGFLHTLLGPDHYLPFVAMSRVGAWSLAKTVVITVLCGIGHVLSSVVLGLAGIAFGIAVLKLENIESVRGDVAGWLLLAFGLVYFIWGVRRAIRNKPHVHRHVHVNGTVHSHEHGHSGEHVHVHEQVEAAAAGAKSASMTPWVLFTIFLFGPCEPLIPLLMYPAAKGSMWGVALVTAVFGLVTITTMTTVVVLSYLAVGSIKFAWLQRYSHAMAGFVVLLCGAAIKVGL